MSFETPQPEITRPTQVTQGESILYGDLGPVIRDFGNGVAAIHHAARTLARYVDEARSLGPAPDDAHPYWEVWERASGIAASVLDTVAEAQREIVREALQDVEHQREKYKMLDGSVPRQVA